MNICEQAEELRLSLIMGLVERSDVIRWADSLIAASEHVPEWVLDVSLAANQSAEMIESKLRDLPCNGNRMTSAYSAIRRFSEAFQSGRLAIARAIRMLELWAGSARVPQDGWTKAMTPTWIADDAMHGIFSSDDVIASVNECIAYFAAVPGPG